jgi:hypothetical protein
MEINKYLKQMFKVIKIIIGVVLIFWMFLVVAFRPSHERDWEIGQENLPKIEANEKEITIDNFRNFNWKEGGEVDKNYETRKFQLDQLEDIDIFISHFDDFEGMAHIFLSFGFSDGEQVVVSAETRREQDEDFSPVLGLARQFEFLYVVGSEKDIIGLRTDLRDERVYLYPSTVAPETAQKIFLEIAKDVNKIHEKPRMYNTLTRNCTNELTRKVEKVSDANFPLTWKTVLPGYFDEVLFEMNLLETDVSFKETKKRSLINNQSVNRHDENFEESLRK